MTTKKGNTDKKKDKSNAEPPKEPESGDNSTNADEKPPEPPPVTDPSVEGESTEEVTKPIEFDKRAEDKEFALDIPKEYLHTIMKSANAFVKKGKDKGEYSVFSVDDHIKEALKNLKMNNINIIMKSTPAIAAECEKIKAGNTKALVNKDWYQGDMSKKCKHLGKYLNVFILEEEKLKEACGFLKIYDFDSFETLLVENGKIIVTNIFSSKGKRPINDLRKKKAEYILKHHELATKETT